MSDELEKSLRAALRPVDPGERFTQAVLARTTARSQASADTTASATQHHPFASRAVLRWSATLMALVIGVGLCAALQWQQHRIRAGLQARQQLLLALNLAGKNLDIAYRVVNKPESQQ